MHDAEILNGDLCGCGAAIRCIQRVEHTEHTLGVKTGEVPKEQREFEVSVIIDQWRWA